MKYRLELDIETPRTRVVELFLDPGNLSDWQPDLVSFEPVSGEAPRAVGAVNRQIHKMGRREVVMTETITEHDYPERFSAIYEADKVWNLIENRFTELGPDKTHWVLDCEFKCGGMVRLMALFFPGMFRKQTMKFMKMFKEFAESAG
jgi:hypothetical protein